MKKYPTEWNLKLLYKSSNDPQIEKDVASIEKIYKVFEERYKNKDFTSSPKKLFKALKDYEDLTRAVKGWKPEWYFALRKDSNSDDKKATALETQISQRLTRAQNKIKFFKLDIAKIPASKHSLFLKAPLLSPYSYYIKTTFNKARYNLSEKEEQLAGLLNQTSYGMWVDKHAKLLSEQTILYKGKKLPIAQAVNMLAELSSRNEREEIHQKINEVYKSISFFSEAEINAIYNFKKIMDERRGFKNPYSSTILAYENDEKAIENLVKLVTKNFSISKRFYTLHSRLLKQKKLGLYDRAVSIGEISKKFDFASAVAICKKAFGKAEEKYPKMLEAFIKNGQVDVYPRMGKKGGAYCWGKGGNNPTFVLLNHTDSVKSVETLAHEMGHAFHNELSKKQPPLYQGHSTATAEVASTLFEQIVFDELEKELNDKERAILLHNKIMGDIASVFRQIAFFNFENELHTRIRKEGELSSGEMALIMNKHLKSYLGPAFELTESDGYFFVALWHLRRFFYVYSYSYGQLISRALFEKWKKDPKYISKIEEFLTSGGSMSPEDIFKKIGVDTSKSDFFKVGLKSIEKDIDKLEKLSRKI